MSEILKATVQSVLDALGRWPVVQGFFIIVISFCGIAAMRRGDKERKQSPNTVEIPVYLMTGPVYEAITKIHQIADEQRQQTQLLEDIRNRMELEVRLQREDKG